MGDLRKEMEKGNYERMFLSLEETELIKENSKLIHHLRELPFKDTK